MINTLSWPSRFSRTGLVTDVGILKWSTLLKTIFRNKVIYLLGEDRANLSAFRTFVRYTLVWFCLFPLLLGVWEGLRLVKKKKKKKKKKGDDFDFYIINFPFLDGDVLRRTSYGIYTSELIRFARASSTLSDFNYRNKALTAKLRRQGYRYFKIRKAFSKFYRRHSALVEKYNISLKTLLQQGISEPECYGELVYKFRKIVGKSNFSKQIRKFINRYKWIGYSLDIMRRTACLVVNPIIDDGFASLFNCMTAVRASDSITPLQKTLTSALELDDMSLVWPAVVQLLVFIYSGIR